MPIKYIYEIYMPSFKSGGASLRLCVFQTLLETKHFTLIKPP